MLWPWWKTWKKMTILLNWAKWFQEFCHFISPPGSCVAYKGGATSTVMKFSRQYVALPLMSFLFFTLSRWPAQGASCKIDPGSHFTKSSHLIIPQLIIVAISVWVIRFFNLCPNIAYMEWIIRLLCTKFVSSWCNLLISVHTKSGVGVRNRREYGHIVYNGIKGIWKIRYKWAQVIPVSMITRHHTCCCLLASCPWRRQQCLPRPPS